MVMELRTRNQSQQLYVRALSSAYRNGVQIYDPSLWLLRDPESEEKMLRDADIAGSIGLRRHAIAGRQWTLVPFDEASNASELAVLIGTELIRGIKHFTDARLNLARAFFSGSRFAEIHGVPKVLTIGDGRPRTWWVPVRLEDHDKRIFRTVPHNDGNTLEAHWERWNVARSEWEAQSIPEAKRTIRHVYQDDQGTLGHGRALREAIGWWWYAKEHVFQESLQAVERFAQGIVHAKVDGARDAKTGKPNETLIADWQAVLEDVRARHILVSDKQDEVDIIQGNAEGWQLLKDIREELRATLVTLILGSNLPTQATEGGSFALAEIQENSTETLIQYDREVLEETLTDDLLGCLWWKNHPNLVELGVAEEKPRFSITQEKKQDPKERADVAEVLNRMGVDLSADELYEQTGFRKPDPGEDIIEGGTSQPDAGFFPGMGAGFKRREEEPFGAGVPR